MCTANAFMPILKWAHGYVFVVFIHLYNSI